MPVPVEVHLRHHAGVEQIRPDQLPVEVFEFADELGLSWWLERAYAF